MDTVVYVRVESLIDTKYYCFLKPGLCFVVTRAEWNNARSYPWLLVSGGGKCAWRLSGANNTPLKRLVNTQFLVSNR